ncbi:MAG: T9SS type A sorting domain-containing protein [Chitinophagaceae bacterium]|nr:T9SS type A sorting domain-containing protein [Chitinophagaceae bacterium]
MIETATGCVDTFCNQITIEGFNDDEYNFKILPPNADGSINLLLTSPTDGTFDLFLTDVAGKKVIVQSSNLSVGTHQYVIPVGENLSIGIYLISIHFNNETIISEKIAVLK